MTKMAYWQLVNNSWWRHQMETFSALLAICAGNSPASGEVPAQRPVKRSFDVFFDLRLNKRLRKQSWGWWFETLSPPLWRHRNVRAIGWCSQWIFWAKVDTHLCRNMTSLSHSKLTTRHYWLIPCMYVLVFVDLRFQHNFIPIYIGEAEPRLYSKGWRLNMETLAGPKIPARSDVECCITCSVTSNCTGANFVPKELMCHIYAVRNVNLP